MSNNSLAAVSFLGLMLFVGTIIVASFQHDIAIHKCNAKDVSRMTLPPRVET